MSQTRKGSMAESAVSVAIGFVVSMVITALVFPLYGMPITTSHNVQITAIFTVASLLRSYVVRRAFNRIGSSRD